MNYKHYNLYSEKGEDRGYNYRENYLNSINKFIETENERQDLLRKSEITPEKFFEDRSFYLQKYRELIGIPSFTYDIPKATKEYIGNDDLADIFRVSIEVIPDYKFYGMLFVPHTNEKEKPLIIAQHGGGGSPEHCCDILDENNYNFFSKRALERGFTVFAPQLLLWRFTCNTGEKFPNHKLPFERALIDAKLKRLGYSITGMEIYSISRAIDYFTASGEIDRKRIGMMGLSYGGFFSIYTAAFDERIKSIYSAAAFNDKTKVMKFCDWCWNDSMTMFGDAEILGLVAPRNVYIDVGKEDLVFDYKPSSNEAERARDFYKYINAEDNFNFNLHEKGHVFDVDKGYFDKFFHSVL